MMNRFMMAASKAITTAVLAALTVALLPTALLAAVPSIVATSSGQYVTGLVYPAGSTNTWVPDKVAVDSKGNLFVADIGQGTVWEIPASGATPFTIITGFSGINGVALDASDNVYASNPYGSNGGGNVWMIPLQNGSYNAAAKLSLNANFGNLDGYYMQGTDVAVDKAGYAYFACGAAGCGGNHSLFKVKTDGTNPVILVKTMPNALTGIAADSVGNLYYADGTNLYTVPSSTAGATPTILGSGFKTPKGVSVDSLNNLYVTDSTGGSIWVIPFEVTTAYPNGGPNPAHQYLLTSGISAGFSPGIDAMGNLYLGDAYASRSVNKLSIGGAVFPAATVGATSAAVVTFAFNTATTPASIAYLQGPTSAGSQFSQNYAACAANTAQAVYSTCTSHINFKPTTVGTQNGAYVLRDSSGNALATAYLSGTGNAPAASFSPGVQTQMTVANSASVTTPSAIAYDSVGSTYVVDTTSNQIVVFPAGGGQGTPIAGTSLSAPGSIAVDGAGNILVADTGNNRLVGIPNVGGVVLGTNQVTLATGLKAPKGVAVGPDGSIYVANTGNAQVLRYATWQGWSSLLQTTVGSGYVLPVALVVDGASNVSVADSTANVVQRVSVRGGTQATVLSGLLAPTSLGLDGAGNMYVVNAGNRSISRYLNTAGTLDPNSGVAVGYGLSAPAGIAVNGVGNAAIADGGNGKLYGLVRTSGLVNFNSVNFGDSSAINQVTLTNSGNLPLTLGTPAYTEAGASTNYLIASSTTSGCTAGATLAQGTACGYNATFIPVATGTLIDTLTFSSNSVSVASPTVTLTGIGTNLAPTGTTLAQTSPAPGAPLAYGQPVTITATVVSKKTGFAAPTGTVSFIVDGQLQSTTSTLSATAPYTASLTLTNLTGGTHSISASYQGDSSNASSSSSALAVTLSPANAKIVLNVAPSVPVAPGTPFTFTATAVSTTTGTPTGKINLLISGQIVGSGTLANGNLAAILLSTLPLGTYQVTAQYLGDVNFAPATSVAVVAVVRYPDFDILMNNTSLTVKAGSSGSLPLTIQPISGYGGVTPTLFNAVVFPGFTYTPPPTVGPVVVTPPCSGLPAYTTCTFAPGSVNFNALNPAPMVMTITTNVTTNTTLPYPSSIPFLPGLLGGLGVLTAVLAAPKQWSRRSMRLTVLAVMLASGLIATGGCGSGIRLQPTTNITPAGTYPLVVTMSGAISTNSGAQTFNATITPSSNVLTNVSSFGSLSVGQTITGGTAYTGIIPTGTVISALSYTAGTITLSNPVGQVTSCTPVVATCPQTPTLNAVVTDTDAVIVHTVNVNLVVQ